MIRAIKKFLKSRTFLKETDMKVISLFIEKTHSVFAGTFIDKTNGQGKFVVGKTEYGPVKIPIADNIYKILQNKITANRTKIPIKIKVGLKIQETKKKNRKETKILAGMVILDENK